MVRKVGVWFVVAMTTGSGACFNDAPAVELSATTQGSTGTPGDSGATGGASGESTGRGTSASTATIGQVSTGGVTATTGSVSSEGTSSTITGATGASGDSASSSTVDTISSDSSSSSSSDSATTSIGTLTGAGTDSTTDTTGNGSSDTGFATSGGGTTGDITLLLSEDFESGDISEGWVVADRDGGIPGLSGLSGRWTVAREVAGTNMLATCTSWYDPAAVADDWLITPLVELGPSAVLRWRGRTQYSEYPEAYEVLVSTTGAGLDEFLVEMPLFATIGEPAQWQDHGVDLSTYAGESVYVAFHYISDDRYNLNLDDIVIEQP